MEQFKTFLKAALTVATPENHELYWFLLELFSKRDSDKDWIVTVNDFPTMMDRV